MQVVVFGGGGHARVCLELLRRRGDWTIAGVLDSLQPAGAMVGGVPVLGDDSVDAMRRVFDGGVGAAVIGVGALERRERRAEIAEQLCGVGFALPPLIHPQASVEPSARIGPGAQVMAGAVVSTDAAVGDICLVNYNAVVAHDCSLASNVHVAPGAVLGGWVTVGAHSLIGMGATIYTRVKIGSRVLVVNGCAVFADVADGQTIRQSKSSGG